MEEHPSESMLDGAEGRRGAKLMKLVPHGEPYAGKQHVRFDEGVGVPDNKGRPALLYTLASPVGWLVMP